MGHTLKHNLKSSLAGCDPRREERQTSSSSVCQHVLDHFFFYFQGGSLGVTALPVYYSRSGRDGRLTKKQRMDAPKGDQTVTTSHECQAGSPTCFIPRGPKSPAPFPHTWRQAMPMEGLTPTVAGALLRYAPGARRRPTVDSRPPQGRHILGHNSVPRDSKKVTTIPKESSQRDLSNGMGPRAVGSILKGFMKV